MPVPKNTDFQLTEFSLLSLLSAWISLVFFKSFHCARRGFIWIKDILLISYLCWQATEQVDLITWPVSVYWTSESYRCHITTSPVNPHIYLKKSITSTSFYLSFPQSNYLLRLWHYIMLNFNICKPLLETCTFIQKSKGQKLHT